MKTFMTEQGIDIFLNTNIQSNWMYDEANVLRQIHNWKTHLPWIKPYYALKCNPSPELVHTLVQEGVGLDAASNQELILAAKYTKDIIYTNPHLLLYEKKNMKKKLAQVRFKVVDDIGELEQMRGVQADILLRMNSGNPNAFDSKFGCTQEEAKTMIHYAKNHSIRIRGVSFHIGSGGDHDRLSSYKHAYEYAEPVLEYLNFMYSETPVLNIGGGLWFHTNLEEVLGWTKNLPYILIAEPGRYFAQPAYHLMTQIIAKTSRGLFLDNGVYHELNVYHRDHWVFPNLTHYYDHDTNTLHQVIMFEPTYILGPTCDSYDNLGICKFPKDYKKGDHIFLEHMGAYTCAGSCNFNGILGASSLMF
jgi:ornithine decarboxylase